MCLFFWIEFAPFKENTTGELVFYFFLLVISGFWWFLKQGGETGKRLLVDKKGIQLDYYYRGQMQPERSFNISWPNVSLVQHRHSSLTAPQKVDISERHFGASGNVIYIHSNDKVRMLVVHEWFMAPGQSLAFLGINEKQNPKEYLTDVINAFAERAQIKVM